MDDLERGQRIKTARLALHLTQPAIVELFEERAKRDGWEPTKPGERAVTLRGLQAWESGGGIRWEKAKWLADVLQLDVNFMMTGREPGEGPTPDLSLRQVRDEFRPDVDVVQDELGEIKAMLVAASSERGRIEAAVAAQNANLEAQTLLLERIELERKENAKTLRQNAETLKEIRQLVGVLQDVRHVERAAAAAVHALRDLEPGPGERGRLPAQTEPRPRPASDRTDRGRQGRPRRAS